mmetsp:Transcript_5503/g.13793  ORF Transcript_5503/g.13793 Transcript_5503/m.13793 type:complete len:201 (-) Transcript_5503:312-914(-)
MSSKSRSSKSRSSKRRCSKSRSSKTRNQSRNQSRSSKSRGRGIVRARKRDLRRRPAPVPGAAGHGRPQAKVHGWSLKEDPPGCHELHRRGPPCRYDRHPSRPDGRDAIGLFAAGLQDLHGDGVVSGSDGEVHAEPRRPRPAGFGVGGDAPATADRGHGPWRRRRRGSSFGDHHRCQPHDDRQQLQHQQQLPWALGPSSRS